MNYEDMHSRALANIPESVKEADRFEVPKVTGYIQGNKTILSNFAQIAHTLDRRPEHLLKYILKELATAGEIKSSGIVIINSKISAVRLNDKVKQYAKEFVICRECGKPETVMQKEGDVNYLKCNACGTKYPIRGKI